MTRPRDGMLLLIGAFKLVKAALIVALALDLLRLGPSEFVQTLARWATRLHIDPDGRHFARAVNAIAGLGGSHVKVVSAGCSSWRASGSCCGGAGPNTSLSS